MSNSDMIQPHVDPILKEQVEDITLFYQQVKQNRGLPFETDIPNAVTRQTLEDTDARRNLIRVQNADELFNRLGI